MTRPDVMRDAIVNMRQAQRRLEDKDWRPTPMGPQEFHAGRNEARETVAGAVKAFVVLLLVMAAFYAAALVVASFAVAYRV